MSCSGTRTTVRLKDQKCHSHAKFQFDGRGWCAEHYAHIVEGEIEKLRKEVQSLKAEVVSLKWKAHPLFSKSL